MNPFRRLAVAVAARNHPPEVPEPPTPEPTREEKAAALSAQLRAIEEQRGELAAKVLEFKKLHMTVTPTRTREGGVRLVEKISSDHPAQIAALQKIWNSLGNETLVLYAQRNRILREGAEVWAKK